MSEPVAAVDEKILKDMLNADVVKPLLEAFGRICGVGAGLFTPRGERIGYPANHNRYCEYIYTTKEGEEECKRCDKKKISDLIQNPAETAKAYDCHAHLIDFCEPIYCQIRGEKRLIGVFFVGQVLNAEIVPNQEIITKIQEVAQRCEVNENELLARYISVPKVSASRIEEIRAWMKGFSGLIGLLVERKAATQGLWLDVINAGDDQNQVVRAVQQNLGQAAVSIFLRPHDPPPGDEDTIFLVASTEQKLAARSLVPLAQDDKRDEIAYPPGRGFTRWVYDTGNVLNIPNVAEDTCYPTYPYKPERGGKVRKGKVQEITNADDTQAFLGVPIYGDDLGKPVGVIRAVRLKGQGAFRADEIELLTGIGSIVGEIIRKVRLLREHKEKSNALNQAQHLLATLTRPEADLESVTNELATYLGRRHVNQGKWTAVYVLQRITTQKRFEILAVYPPDLDHKGYPFPEDSGVAGHMLQNDKRLFAELDCTKTLVQPAKNWESVVAAQIVADKEMWGAVALCGNKDKVSQSDVDAAQAEVLLCAEHISIVCKLTELFEAKNTQAQASARLLSLALDVHEAQVPLQAAVGAAYKLECQLTGIESQIAVDMRKNISEALGWASVCYDLSNLIIYCNKDPQSALMRFRDEQRKQGQPKQMNLGGIVDRVVQRVQKTAEFSKARVTYSLGADTWIEAYEEMLYRAFCNLLENAILSGSKIQAGEYREGVQISFSTTSSDDEKKTRVTIQDNGVGICPASLSAIQEVYADPLNKLYRSPGIGTTLIAFAVALHDGQIHITSRVGEGTCVKVELPSRPRKGE